MLWEEQSLENARQLSSFKEPVQKMVHGGGSTFDVVSRLQSQATPVPKIPR